MIISHSKKFIFLHGRKTAGTSVGVSLMRHLESGDAVRGYIGEGLKHNIKPPDWHLRWFYLTPQDIARKGKSSVLAYRRMTKVRHNITSTHMTASEAAKLVGPDKWEIYFTFTIERNPFDRLLSFYYWRKKSKSVKVSFEYFVNALLQNDIDFLEKNELSGFSNQPFYMINNKIAVDAILRYENLYNDLEYVHKRLNLEYDGWLPNAKSGITDNNKSVHELINKSNISNLEEYFNTEYKIFNYQYFDVKTKKIN